VIGGGNAALCAAITARRRGARVLVLESATKDFRGGNSRHTRDIRYMHGRPPIMSRMPMVKRSSGRIFEE
jgi:tricarballylate dehydrogenase